MKIKRFLIVLSSLLFSFLLVDILLVKSGDIHAKQAALITVNTTEDDNVVNGNCTLREAITAANTDSAVDNCAAGNGKDTIELPVGVISLTISGSGEDNNASGDLDISSNLQIVGRGILSSTVSADRLDRVFHIMGPVEVGISGLAIEQGGNVEQGGGIYSEGVLTLTQISIDDNQSQYWGGGIFNTDLGTLSILTSTVSQNSVTDLPSSGCMGGGIHNAGDLVIQASAVISNSAYCAGGINNLGVMTITNSTVSGNIAAFEGGVYSGGQALLINVTIAKNEARDTAPAGGGITGKANLMNTIVADNLGGNCGGTVQSGGHNIDSEDSCGFNQASDLVNTDPLISVLQDNGGETFTHALLSNSPAIDAGSSSICPATDQRGMVRPFDGDGNGIADCDIGAFEYISASPSEGTVITVTTTADEIMDNGKCSLREAVLAANNDRTVDTCAPGTGDDMIILPSGTYSLTLAGAGEDNNQSGDLDIKSNLSIQGEGVGDTVIAGGGKDRVLDVLSGAHAKIRDVQVTAGWVQNEVGGGLRNSATLTLEDCTVSDNHSGPVYIDEFGTYNGGDGGGIYNSGTLTVTNCSVYSNSTSEGSFLGRFSFSGDGGKGGGIFNRGVLVVTKSSFWHNSTGEGGSALGGIYFGPGGEGGDGGGIYNSGVVQIWNTTFSGNSTGSGGSAAGCDPLTGCYGGGSGGDGGGIYNDGTLKLVNTTIYSNSTGAGGNPSGSGGNGGGVFGGGDIKNAILAGNTTAGVGPDCAGVALTSYGFNLIEETSDCSIHGDTSTNLTGLDPMLLALGDYGGDTKTHSLLFSSPAIDAGDCQDIEGNTVLMDQRGISRPQGADCDIGAYEWDVMYLYAPIIRR